MGATLNRDAVCALIFNALTPYTSDRRAEIQRIPSDIQKRSILVRYHVAQVRHGNSDQIDPLRSAIPAPSAQKQTLQKACYSARSQTSLGF